MTRRRISLITVFEGDLLAARPLARPHHGEHRLAGGGLEDQHRLEAGGAGVRIEDLQFLLAVRGIVGIVDVERDALGRLRPAAAEQIDEAEPDLDQRPPIEQVLKGSAEVPLLPERSRPARGQR